MIINTAYQEKSRDELLQIIEQLSWQVKSLTELVNINRQRQFASKSEKISPNQISLFDEADMPKQAEKIEEVEASIRVGFVA